jgi:hypothetical protein
VEVVELIALQVEAAALEGEAGITKTILAVALETHLLHHQVKVTTAAMVLALMTRPEAVVVLEPLVLLRQQATQAVMEVMALLHLYQAHL